MPASDNIISFHLFKLFTANPWFLNVSWGQPRQSRKQKVAAESLLKPNATPPHQQGQQSVPLMERPFLTTKRWRSFFTTVVVLFSTFFLSALWKYWRSAFCFYIYISVTFQFLVLHEISIGWKVSSGFWHTFSRIKVLCARTESLTSTVETRKKRRKRRKNPARRRRLNHLRPLGCQCCKS